MIRYFILTLLFAYFSLQLFSQGTSVYLPNKANNTVPFPGEPCASEYAENELLKDPAYAQTRANFEAQIQQYIQQNSGSRAAGVVYTIPVVFHVMHSGEAVGDSTNISYAQALSCIDALNRDFRRTAADGGIANSGPLGIDAEIEFCMAQRDPNGNATNGVTRHDMSGNQAYLDSGVYHTSSLWRSDFSMKSSVNWDNTQYMNVWVVNKIRNLSNIYSTGGYSGGVQGYAFFPGAPSPYDGVVMVSSAVGNDPTGALGYNLWGATLDNRVFTHEVGHYLNLFHTFSGTDSCTQVIPCSTGGDRCCDTPTTIVGAGNNCTAPVCPLDNKENYMQYQNGACASDFTPDQVARMRAVLALSGSSGRNALVTNNNCIAPPAIDLELDTIFVPTDTICSLTFIPEIVVCNNSSTDIVTAFNVDYQVDAGALSIFNWTGNLLAGECDTFFLPSVASTNGVHTFTARVDTVNINGTDNDINSSNNFKINSFTLSGSNVAVLQTVTACDSFVSPSGKVWKTNGTFSDTLTNTFGCDSLLSFNVTITTASITNINLSGCDSVVSLSGKIYKSSGVYFDTTFSSGCDSVFIVNVTINHPSIGDSVIFEWVNQIGGTSNDNGNFITIDEQGNIFTIGYFQGTIDFDPGAGVFNLTSNGSYDVFISKLDPNKNLIWAKSFGSSALDDGYSISLDKLGNIYATGTFQGTADFDPGVGVFNLTSNGSYDIFVSKLDPNGNFIWARSFGGGSVDEGTSVVTDASGNVYSTGIYQGTVDFNPGVGTFNLTSNGSNDIFISKLDANGNYVWAKNIGGTGNDYSSTLIIDDVGNIYTTGFFEGTVDFDPGASIVNQVSNGTEDVFIVKLNGNGTYLWSKNIGGVGNDKAYSIVLDDFGYIYTTGYFTSTVDFDPGAGVSNLVSNGAYDVFVSKLDLNGNYVWAKNFGGSSIEDGRSITTDVFGNVYITGSFFGTVDFDPGIGNRPLTSNGSYDAYINRLDSNGNFGWAQSLGETGSDYGYSITTDVSGNIYTTGYFERIVDFDPGVGVTNLTSRGGRDGYILKLNQEFVVVDSVCISYTSPNGKVITTTSIFSDTLTNINGCDSIVRFDIFILPRYYDSIVDTVCETTTWRGTTYTTSGIYKDTVIGGCDSIYVLNLFVDTIITTLIDSTICFGDSIVLMNGIIGKTTGSFFDTITQQYCDSILRYDLTILPLNDTVIFDTICSSQTYTLPGGGNPSVSGIYRDTLAGANCDSIVITNLQIKTTSTSTQMVNACDSLISPTGKIWKTTGVFLDTLTNAQGCDSLMTFNLTISTEYRDTLTVSRCDSSFDWRGTTYFTSILISDTVTTGICDSIFTLDFTRNTTYFTSSVLTGCDSATLITSGRTVYTTGIYSDTFSSINGCDSTFLYNVIIGTSTSSTQTISVCDSLVTSSGKVFKSSGTYFDTLINSQGCDSLMTINLTILTATIVNNPVTIACDSIQVNGTWYFTSQNLYDTISSSTGCDTIVVDSISITTGNWTSLTFSVCDSFVSVTNMVFLNSGTYYDILPNIYGCDSIIEYNLTVNYSASSTSLVSACDTFISPNGKIYTTTGVYQDTLLLSTGCDSIVTIYLVIDTPVNVTLSPSFCEGDSIVLSDGTVIKTSGTYFDTVVGNSSQNTLLFDEDFSGAVTSFILNTTDAGGITPGTRDNAWIINSSYAGGTVFGVSTIDPTPPQNPAITGGINSSYLHIHSRYAATFSSPSITNANYIDASLTFLAGNNGLNVSRMSTDITTGGMNYVSFEMYYLCKGSYGRIYYSTDAGLTWNRVGGNFNNGNNGWTTATITDPAFANQATLRFAVGFNNTNGTGASPGFAVDEIKIRGVGATKACDSITQINLTVIPTYRDTLVDTVCDQTVWRGQTVTNSGTYRDTVFSGCDSIFVLQLQVDTTPRITIDSTICQGDSIVLSNGTIIKTTGTYIETITRATFICDSVNTFNVTVLVPKSTTVNASICAGLPYTLPGGTTTTIAGTYQDTLVSLAGCDSIITTNLSNSSPTSSTILITSCLTYTSPSGKIYTVSGPYSDTIPNAAGCDSVITIGLTILQNATFTFLANGCDTYTLPSGTIVTTGGSYTDTVLASNGCDSIITINLVLGQSSKDSNTFSLCAGQTVIVGSNTYGATGVYRDTFLTLLGCDSIIVTNLTINPITPATITSTVDLCADANPVTFTATPAGGTWGGNGVNTASGLFDPAMFGAGIYTITYTSPGLCGMTDSVVVNVYSVPNIVMDITDDECDFSVGGIDVSLTGGTLPITYSWSTGDTTQDLVGIKQGSYSLSVVDNNGCTDSETAILTNLNSDTCDYNVYIPNVFSPNGDGENDVFQVEGAGIETVELSVYNRYGNLVFQSNSQSIGWDGTFKGQQANPDVFVYFAKGTFVDGTEFNEKGTVTIIRR